MTLFDRLNQKLDATQHHLTRLDAYYRGEQPLSFLSPEAKAALSNRLTTMGTNICRLSISSLAERLRITGFHNQTGADSTVWAAWRRNDLDQLSDVAHREALTLGRAYAIVWADRAGRAQVSIESARQVTTVTDPGTREVVAGLKKWETATTTEAMLYEPDKITHLRAQQTGAVAGFTTVNVIDNPLGEVVVTPIVNTDRLLDIEGVSEMADLLPLVDGLNKILADLLVSSEYFARPRRWATGIELQTDDEGELIDPFPEGYRMMVSESPDTKFGSLPAADLAAYESAVKVLTAQISAVSGLPQHYLGILTNQPASADALRAAEASLTARAQARQHTFGPAWERVARHMLAVQTGADPNNIDVSVTWADPSTRSLAQEADAVVKMFTAGLLPSSYALQRLGYSDADVELIRTARRADSLDSTIGETLPSILGRAS